MLPNSIRTVLTRDVRAVIRQVEAYPDDDLLWSTVPGISNPAGTLALHAAGNLRYYIGAVLGGSGYRRDRDREFSARGLTRDELRAELEAAGTEVETALAALSPARCENAYPEQVGGRTVRTGDFLVHLVAHLGYHLGQIDYHRRVLVPGARPVPAIVLGELPEAGAAESSGAG